jgi:hypothetical protein
VAPLANGEIGGRRGTVQIRPVLAASSGIPYYQTQQRRQGTSCLMSSSKARRTWPQAKSPDLMRQPRRTAIGATSACPSIICARQDPLHPCIFLLLLISISCDMGIRRATGPITSLSRNNCASTAQRIGEVRRYV